MEDIDISREPLQQEKMDVVEKRHTFLPVIFAGFALAVIILIGFFITKYDLISESYFGIPEGDLGVVIFDQNTLYLFDTKKEELKELGIFEVEDIDKVSISSNYKNILFVEDNKLLRFTSFKDGEVIATNNKPIENIAVSGEIVLFSSGELSDRNERLIYTVLGTTTEIFAIGTTPFFINSDTKLVVGTFGGFRMFDLESEDFLDTEAPFVPLSNIVKSSKSGNKIALVSTTGGVHVYNVLTNRPFSLTEAFFLVVPGVYDAVVSDDGILAFLNSIEGVTYISIYNPITKEILTKELPISVDSHLLIWNK